MARPNVFRFDLQVYTWCDQSKHWELIIRCPIGSPQPQPLENLIKPIKLPFVKESMSFSLLELLFLTVKGLLKFKRSGTYLTHSNRKTQRR